MSRFSEAEKPEKHALQRNDGGGAAASATKRDQLWDLRSWSLSSSHVRRTLLWLCTNIEH